jgi:hypothetical protein
MKQAERLIRQGECSILGLAATYRKCWQAACKYDGVDPDIIFVNFSRENPYVYYLDRLFNQYQEVLAAYMAWGYVGLRILSRSRRNETYG